MQQYIIDSKCQLLQGKRKNKGLIALTLSHEICVFSHLSLICIFDPVTAYVTNNLANLSAKFCLKKCHHQQCKKKI